jgi:hypothetical protein
MIRNFAEGAATLTTAFLVQNVFVLVGLPAFGPIVGSPRLAQASAGKGHR